MLSMVQHQEREERKNMIQKLRVQEQEWKQTRLQNPEPSYRLYTDMGNLKNRLGGNGAAVAIDTTATRTSQDI